MVDSSYPIQRQAFQLRAGNERLWLASIAGVLRSVWSALWPPFVMMVLVAGAWELMARSAHNPLIPNTSTIAGRLYRIVGSGVAFEEMGHTLLRVLVGLAVAFPVAIVVGVACGRSERARRLFEPVVLLGLTIPSLVWALLCVIWFGLGLTNPVVTVILASVPALSLNIQQGAAAIGSDLTEMAYIYRFSFLHRLVYIWIPGISPYLMAGLRLGLSHAWKVVVLVEIFGMPDGMGYQISQEFGSHNVAGVLAWTLVFALAMSVIEFGLLKNVERLTTRWRTVSKI